MKVFLTLGLDKCFSAQETEIQQSSQRAINFRSFNPLFWLTCNFQALGGDRTYLTPNLPTMKSQMKLVSFSLTGSDKRPL